MITLLGAQGVGKSTLLNAVKDEITIIESPSREIQKASILINNKDISQPFINAAAHHLHREFIGVNDVIFARSVLDMIIWSKLMAVKDIDSGLQRALTTQITEMEALLEETANAMIVCYIPIEFELTGDQYRPDDKRLQKLVDNEIKAALNNYSFLHACEIKGDIQSRKAKLRKVLSL